MPSRVERPDPLEGHPRYEKLEDLSSGSFGFVLKARDKSANATPPSALSIRDLCCREEQRICAIKFLPRGRTIRRYVLREILNHRSLRHPHVVQFYEVFVTADYLAIVMEFADQGDLFSFVQVGRGCANVIYSSATLLGRIERSCKRMWRVGFSSS